MAGVMLREYARLEDNIFVRRGAGSNVDLVEKVKRSAEFEREIATPAEARQMLD
jgi:uncharacterized protein (DUF849 family)